MDFRVRAYGTRLKAEIQTDIRVVIDETELHADRTGLKYAAIRGRQKIRGADMQQRRRCKIRIDRIRAGTGAENHIRFIIMSAGTLCRDVSGLTPIRDVRQQIRRFERAILVGPRLRCVDRKTGRHDHRKNHCTNFHFVNPTQPDAI